METNITSFLLGVSKKIWPTFPLNIGRNALSNGPHTRKEEESLHDICLCKSEPRENDLKEIVINHVKVVGLTHPVIHEVNYS
jgi:hypothetical protein